MGGSGGISLIIIAVFSWQLFACVNAWGAEKVKLKDVQVLTLKHGQMTAGRRSNPVPQLNCVGGSARCEFLPRVVQCYNKGSDGYDVQWECKADLDNDVRFGDINVSCEGYDYPDDPYVLKGSCGLEYTIDFTKEGEQRYYSGQGHSHPDYGWKSNLYSKPAKNQKFTNIACVAVVAIIVYAIYKTCISPSEQTRQRSTTNDDYDRRGPGSGSGSGPPPPGFRSDYYQGSGTDSFGDSCSGNRGAGSSGTGSGFGFSRNAGGFWTGAAAGGLLGYMFGNRNNNADYNGSTYQRPRPSTSSGYSSSSFGFGSPSSSSSSGSRSSSGFGGTSRR